MLDPFRAQPQGRENNRHTPVMSGERCGSKKAEQKERRVTTEQCPARATDGNEADGQGPAALP